MKLTRLGALALAAGLAMTSASTSRAQSLDNKGSDFVLAFLQNFDTSVTTELHLTADTPTMVTVEYPVNAPTFSTTVAVVPGTITIVGVPGTSSYGWAADTVANNCVHAFAGDEFVCYMVNRRPFSTDAALALPVDTMNTEYIAAGYYASFFGEFAVVAAFDNTTVEVTPSTDLVGHPAGSTFSVLLNRGEAYFAAALAGGDITGSVITSDRPVGVTNGNRCTNIPTGVAFCDHIFEVAQPVQSWGDSAAVANLPLRANGTIYRILASADGTEVFQDGVSLGLVDRGAFIETPELTGDHVFSGSAPIFVIQYMTGRTSPGSSETGDPAMGNMVPTEQYLDAYTFATVGDGQFAFHYLTIIASNADVGALVLDGVPVAAAEFSPIGASGYSAATLSLAEGTHSTASPNPHGITVEGYNTDDSYIYPGGALFQFINPVGDANEPICEVLGTTSTSLSGRARDDRPTEDVNGNGQLDPGEDLNGNNQIDRDTGIFFVQLAPGSTNLALVVDPFVPGDPSATFTVSLIDPMSNGEGSVIVTDGAGNQCPLVVMIQVGSGCMYGGLGDIVGVDAANQPTVFPTIQAAIDDPNQVEVLVFTGNYAERPIVSGKSNWRLHACGQVSIEGLYVKRSSNVRIEDFEIGAGGVFLVGGATGTWASSNVTLAGCQISGAATGVRMDPGHQGIRLEDCSIVGCWNAFGSWDYRTGVVGGDVTFLRCDLSDNLYDAVSLYPDVEALLEECTLTGNGKAAVALAPRAPGAGTPERVTLLRNVFADNHNGVVPGISTVHLRYYDQMLDATDDQANF